MPKQHCSKSWPVYHQPKVLSNCCSCSLSWTWVTQMSNVSLNSTVCYWDTYSRVLVWFGGWLWSSGLTHGLSKVVYWGHVTSESCGDGVHWLTAFDSRSAAANTPPEVLLWNIRAVWTEGVEVFRGLGGDWRVPVRTFIKGLESWHLNGTRDEERPQLVNEIGNRMAATCQASHLTLFKSLHVSLQSRVFTAIRM